MIGHRARGLCVVKGCIEADSAARTNISGSVTTAGRVAQQCLIGTDVPRGGG
jgi:hypothetical protein